ncbi:MAG: PEP-CTERM system TPR-repeat protein PrsT [Rhodospirillaceae bacterium]|jgi:cellulose synthase operon protein C|nr:PEP-CTERM system TPR-repeat protein PrsT [Rhodospirillaceae bacterium]MBT5457874.1 PEP-CTERM system TPR-repeat protein PrsT [Rhodospirillaceae bacterium]
MTKKPLIYWILALMIAPLFGTGTVANTANERSYEFAESAIELFNNGDYRGAIIQLKNALQQYPRNPTARMLLGRAYLRLGEGELAERELLLARRTGAHPNLILIPLGKTFLLQRKYKEIFDQIRPGQRGSRIEAEVLGLRGRAYLAQRDVKKAELAFREAARLQRGKAFPLLGLARTYSLQGDLDEAEGFVDKASALESNNSAVWYEKAEIRRARQDNPGALKSYNKAIDLQKNHIPARLGRASILVQLRRDEEALVDIEYVRERAPRETRVAYLHSIVLTRAGKINEAQAILTEAENLLKKRDPEFVRNHPSSLLLLGVIGHARKNYEDSFHYLNRYIKFDPNHAGSRKLLGSMFLRKGEAWSAIKVLKPALQLAPKDPEILTLLGNAYMRVRQYSDATTMLERASALAPTRASIQTQLGLSKIASGQTKDAEDNLEAALKLSPDGSRPDLLLGLFHLKKGEYDKALKTARLITEKNPLNPFAFNLAGAAEMGKGNLAAAREQFETAIQIDANYAPAYFNLAKLDLAEGKIDDAKARYDTILSIRPKNIKAMEELARVAMSQNELSEAISLLKEIAVLDPDAIKQQILLMDIYLRQKKLDTALNMARDLEITHPTDPDVVTALGRVLLLANKPGQAAIRFRRLAEISPQRPEALRQVAIMQENARDIDGARDTLKKAAALNPNYLPVQTALIRFEARSKNIETALELTNGLREAHPDFRGGDLVAGELYMRARRYKEAIAAFTAAAEKDRKFDAVGRLYDAKFRAGETEDAFKLISDWVTENPDDFAAKRVLASAYRRTGLVDKAIDLNQTLLSKFPNDTALLNNLAGLFQKTGDKRAFEFAQKAYRLAPQHPVTLDTFGWILVQRGDAERGLVLLRQAFTRAADSPEVRYHLAVALNLTGRAKEARDELEKALEIGGEFDGVKDARLLLRKLKGG